MQTSTGVYLEELFASVIYVSKQSKISAFSILYFNMKISVSQDVYAFQIWCFNFLMFQFLLAERIHLDLLFLPSLSSCKYGFGMRHQRLGFQGCKAVLA